jgi:hypothetical protein
MSEPCRVMYAYCWLDTVGGDPIDVIRNLFHLYWDKEIISQYCFSFCQNNLKLIYLRVNTCREGFKVKGIHYKINRSFSNES